MPQLDWAGELASTRVDYNGEEVKTAQLVTWRQLEPALPPRGKAGCVRAADLLEGWARACMEDPTKTLLPEDKWPDELPQPQVWVESQNDWHEICAGAAERGIFTFLEEQDVFHFQGKPLLNGLFGVEKKNKSLDSGDPVLRMIINAIPANALEETIEADIRTLPYFGQWSAVAVDEEDRAVVWNELDMTSAFYVFLLEPPWYKFQALAKPVSGQFASRWVPICGPRKACTLRWQSWPWGGNHTDSCNRFTGSFVSSPSPWKQRWTHPERFGAMVLFREAAGHMIQASTACTWMGSAMPNSSIGISSVIPRSGVGKQKQYTRLGTVGESRPRHGKQSSANWSWRPWGVELMLAPPRSVVSRLIGLTAWFAQNPTQRRHTAEILGGRWVRYLMNIQDFCRGLH